MTVARMTAGTMTNFRKRKKALTTLVRIAKDALSINPFNSLARVNMINAVFLLKELKDVKRSKKEAKTAQYDCCFGVDKKSRLAR